MSKQTLITSNDPKGLQFVRLCTAAYNKAKLDEDRAQRLNENGGELTAGLKELIEKFSVTNQFANEEVESNYGYPAGYAVKSLLDQCNFFEREFGLDIKPALDFAEYELPKLVLPDGAEGWFAIPSMEALAKIHFPKVTDPKERYCRAVQLVLAKIGESRTFYNYREGQITLDRLRQHERALQMLAKIAKTQKGDVLIIAAQFGLRHRGRSVRRAREVFAANEFGLGAFAVACMLLTHHEREVEWEQLHVDCAGDEYDPDAAGRFGRAPIFDFGGGKVRFGAGRFGNAGERYGSASGFLPQ